MRDAEADYGIDTESSPPFSERTTHDSKAQTLDDLIDLQPLEAIESHFEQDLSPSFDFDSDPLPLGLLEYYSKNLDYDSERDEGPSFYAMQADVASGTASPGLRINRRLDPLDKSLIPSKSIEEDTFHLEAEFEDRPYENPSLSGGGHPIKFSHPDTISHTTQMVPGKTEPKSPRQNRHDLGNFRPSPAKALQSKRESSYDLDSLRKTVAHKFSSRSTSESILLRTSQKARQRFDQKWNSSAEQRAKSDEKADGKLAYYNPNPYSNANLTSTVSDRATFFTIVEWLANDSTRI